MPTKREVLKPQSRDTRYVRRDAQGKFTDDQVGVGRSLAQDRKKKANTTVPKGQGDKGDQKRRS